jgi:hypothetical protein
MFIIRVRYSILAGIVCLFGILACGQPAEPANPTLQAATIIPSAIVPSEPVITGKGIVVIQQTTSTENVGTFPLFQWEAVPGAVSYTLVVKTAEGRPYWFWEGAETSVFLGGGGSEPPPEGSVGPRLFEPMTWTVYAFAADDRLVGASARRPISP